MRKNAKKLVLSKETLRSLDSKRLQEVAGAYRTEDTCNASCYTDSCVATCDCDTNYGC